MKFRWTLEHDSLGTEVLSKDPEGWRKIEFSIKRDEAFHGLFHDFSVELGFFCNGGGRDMIENALAESEGIDEEVTLLIEVDCNDNGTYTELYSGRLLLDTVRFDKTYLYCNIVKEGIEQLVNNRENIQIDLNSGTGLDGSSISAMTQSAYDLTLHSKAIFAESELDDDIASQHDFSMAPDEAVKRFWCCVPYEMVKNELEETATPSTLSQKTSTATTIDATNLLNFHDSTPQSPRLLPGDYDVEWDFSGTYKDNVPNMNGRIVGGVDDIKLILTYGQSLANSTDVELGRISGYTQGSGTALYSTTFNFTGSTTISMNPGDKLWLFWIVDGYDITTGTAGVPYDIEITFDHSGGGDTANLTFSITSTIGSTTCKAWAIHEAFATIVESMTGQADSFRSEYFGRTDSDPHSYADNGCGSFLAVTNGYAIRKFPLSEHSVWVSFAQLFDAMNALWNIGMGIDDDGTTQHVRVEDKGYFYDSTVVLQIDGVDDLVERVAPQYYTNTISVGYAKHQVEEINSLDEFCTQHQYSTLMKNNKNNIDAVSKFIASGYAIEYTRRLGGGVNLFGKETTDWRYDSDNFLICLNRSVDSGNEPTSLDTAEKNENLSSVSGLIDEDSIYNARISPKRNLLRWIKVLGASLLNNAGADVKFTGGEANDDASWAITDGNCAGDYSGVALAEDANVDWDSANLEDGTPVWQPWIYEFSAPLSLSDYLTLKASPNQTIEFSEGNSDYMKGFVLDVKYNVVDGKATFQLLKSNL